MKDKVADKDIKIPGVLAVKVIGFRIESDTAEKLDEICYREGIGRSALIKRLIRQYVKENY